MPELRDGAIFSFLLTIMALIILRARAGKPRLAAWKLVLAGIAAAYIIPEALALQDLVNIDRFFIFAWTAVLVLGVTHRPDAPPRLSLPVGVLAGVGVAVVLPLVLDLATGTFGPASLRADLNRCATWNPGQEGLAATNTCDEPVTVGLCLPGEVNPAPCVQSQTIGPGESAAFDPRGSGVSSLPANPDGFTTVACRPPARPSRTKAVGGRGYDGVCLPPE